MEDFFSLKILDLFRPLFEAFGVEYEKMRLIVNMKLTLDKRKNNSSENKNSLMQSVILYLIIGFVASRIIVMQLDIMTKMTVLFALIFVMLLTCFITDCSGHNFKYGKNSTYSYIYFDNEFIYKCFFDSYDFNGI